MSGIPGTDMSQTRLANRFAAIGGRGRIIDLPRGGPRAMADGG